MMIPAARLIMTYQMKVLLGISSIKMVPTKLFRQVALLKLIGYATTEMEVGFCQRGNLAAGPMHNNTLADAVERLSSEELEHVLNQTARRLRARGFFKGSKGHFALDATDLETTARYEGAGVKKYTEWKVDKETKKAVEAVTGHVFLTLLTFTLAGAFRSSRGQELAKHGIRRQRAEEEDANVIVFSGEYYAIFHIEEVSILLGVVPEVLLRANPRELSRTYGLALAA